MILKEIIHNIVPKNFETIFEEKINGIKGINSNIDSSDIKDLKSKFWKVLAYNEKLILAKELIIKNGDLYINDSLGRTMIGCFQDIITLVNWLQSELNIQSSQNSLNVIFQPLISILDKSLYSPIFAQHNINSGEVVVDAKIRIVEGFISLVERGIGKIEKDDEANALINNILQNKESIKESLNWIVEFNKEQQKNIQLNLDKNATNFAKKSSEFKNGYTNESFFIFDNSFSNFIIEKKIFFVSETVKYLKGWRRNPSFSGREVWLVFASIMGIITFTIIIFFIKALGAEKDVSLGFAVIRISALIIPGYFTFFCLKEYTNAKRLYEKYQFKNISLETMNKLLSTNGNEYERKEILSKGIDIIFSEPLEKEDTSSLKEYIGDLKDIAKSKITGN